MVSSNPYSIRFTEKQRRYIQAKAHEMHCTEAAWIKYKLFDGQALVQNKELSHLKYLLGQTRYASNLNQLAKHANQGNVIGGPDTEQIIIESRDHIVLMSRTLISAIGLRA